MELRDPEDATDINQKPDLIIGNVITSGSADNTLVTSSDPVYVRPGAFVYRNAYIVSVKGRRYAYNSSSEKYEVQETKKIYLKPLAVIPDGIKYKGDHYSDRVIFEGDFVNDDGDPEFFNQLELQIYWENSAFMPSESIRQDQMGIIHDLVFSTDRVIK